MKKDPQFKKLLELSGNLVRLGEDLACAIDDYAMYNAKQSWGKSPHMKEAVYNWRQFIKNNFGSLK